MRPRQVSIDHQSEPKFSKTRPLYRFYSYNTPAKKAKEISKSHTSGNELAQNYETYAPPCPSSIAKNPDPF